MATPNDAPGNVPRKAFDGSAKAQVDLKETFHRYFQDEVHNVQEHIDKLERTPLVAGERQDVIDYCLANISRLTTEVQDALDFIPAYDQRSYTTTINNLKEKFQEARLKFAPKSRFTFKIKKNASALSLADVAIATDAAESALHMNTAASATPAISPGQASVSKNYNEDIAANCDSIRHPSFSRATSVVISEHKGLHIILPPSASHVTSLTDLTRCIVDMSVSTVSGAPFAGLALKNIKQSLIIAGQVAGAAHLTSLKDCVVVVESRQVRMHDCLNVDVYLKCMSEPIIEDCKGIRFAPLPAVYKNMDSEETQDRWNEVKDFKWLKAEHSPNWCLMPEEEMLKERVWREVVPGVPGKAVEDILKEVGIKK